MITCSSDLFLNTHSELKIDLFFGLDTWFHTLTFLKLVKLYLYPIWIFESSMNNLWFYHA
ncbi:hypothetical protein HanIR_Chr09g0401211 [Helianthus annuus]|nr:hypothetical protein HanIR_Chr09g0401211 [Helianthus annuus]